MNQYPPQNPSNPNAPTYPVPQPARRGCLYWQVNAWVTVLLIVAFSMATLLLGHYTGPNAGSGSSPAQAQSTSPTSASTPTTPKPTAPPPAWQTTQNFSGNGTQKTSTFAIAGDHWKLLWTCDPASFNGLGYNVIVDVDSPGQDLPIFPAAVNALCSDNVKSGSTEEYQSGTFYLAVNSEAAWTVTIQELK